MSDYPAAPSHRICATWRDYLSLTKPRIVALLLLTTLVAMSLANEGDVPGAVWLWTAIGGALSAGGAGAVNCALDGDVDEQMSRTSQRAVPAGRIPAKQALRLGLALGALSLITLWRGANPLAAGLSLVGFVQYVLVYTLWLKRRTPHNIVIGGLAGALPPLVGWAAATGRLAPTAWVLAGIVLAWTPPHFWALAVLRRDEYARAGLPLLPVVHGEQATRRAILALSALTVMLSLAPLATGALHQTYAVAAGLGAGLLLGALRLVRGAEQTVLRSFYLYTIAYLGVLFASMPLAD